MKRKIKAFVDGAGGDVGQGVLKSLIDSSLDIEIYTSCIDTTSSWLYKIKNSYIFPLVSDECYIQFLIDFLNEHTIDVYFPTIDSSLCKLSKHKSRIEECTNTKIFIDDLYKIKICDDKYLTIQFLKQHKFDSPNSYDMVNCQDILDFIDQNHYPFILKPKSGNGAKSIIHVTSFNQIKPFIGNDDWMLQETLDIENEITCGIYIGNDHVVKGLYILKRLLKCGSTYQAERIFNLVIENKILDIAKIMNMKYLNIQAVYKNDVLLPFEFNGRLSGTTGAMKQIFNAPELYIKEEILKEKIYASDNQEKIYISRYNEEVIYTESDKKNLVERSNQNKK